MGKYVTGLQLMFLGMGTVLVVLYLIQLFLNISGKYFGPEEEQKEKAEKPKVHEKTVDTPEEETGIDPAKVAAISTAIYEVVDRNNYRIISIEKKSDAWKR